jgi:hypothetical protein
VLLRPSGTVPFALAHPLSLRYERR